MTIAVVGLGKIGLPLAVQYAGKGHRVIGVDVNPRVVELVGSGTEPFPGEADLDVRLKQVVADGRLRATTDYAAAIPDASHVVVVVPLFVDAEGVPDFGWMDAATGDIGAHLTRGTTVIYETTLPVGTTRTRWKPALEQRSGLTCGTDFWVAFSPERVLTGRVFADLRRYPKLIGGLDPVAADRARALYAAVLDFDDRPDLPRPNGVWDLGSAEAAELAKLAETTYRDVNIGLANQFARYAGEHGIDIHAVIDASNSQPYSHIHRPGIAVGGHCIPVYPRLYLWNDPSATVVRAARDANSEMPAYAVGLLAQSYGDLAGARVVVLGAAYRGGVKETAFSGVFPTVHALRAAGADVVVHDPLYADDELTGLGFTAYHLGEPVDAAIVQADHADYRGLGPADLPGIRALVDGRALTDATRWREAGVLHRTIGVA
ncbi:nucleotide sugar dehydrogenase [Actinopolymorpha sp. B17G11]|uniref:nucleotide sugar dehydrogenase n=1 Tax=Actinopolymorpha sp. B17G11 TaxID=3160861 RepID=UPI0032E40A59